jgi:hypothetical protein
MINFWKDIWFGHCSLATLIWDLYYIVIEKNITIAEVWDGTDLKFTFRRTIGESLMGTWFDFLEIARSTTFTDENGHPVSLILCYSRVRRDQGDQVCSRLPPASPPVPLPSVGRLGGRRAGEPRCSVLACR